MSNLMNALEGAAVNAAAGATAGAAAAPAAAAPAAAEAAAAAPAGQPDQTVAAAAPDPALSEQVRLRLPPVAMYLIHVANPPSPRNRRPRSPLSKAWARRSPRA